MADSLARWDPFRDLVSIQDELNRLFGRTFSGSEGMRPMMAGSWMPSMDVYETDNEVVAKVELAGIDPKDVDVSIDDATLTVTGMREFTREANEDQYRRIERRYGSFARSIMLPQGIDTQNVQASFDKGVLTVTVPKTEKAKPRKVEIKAA